ncbi:M20/M25/M40 family metallo-hydrolase [Actinoplanes sp. NPDC051494]|uniref:M20/M25/M40 family metallo-hydrolase n=1 Tax=Actinoplanes sp. NPDC051494 TaxID=3363907 RepID=UPI0037B7D5CF
MSLRDRMTARLPSMVADIERLVRCESPSSDPVALAASTEAVAALGTRLLGAEPERLTVDNRVHLRWRLGAGPSRVLLLGHHDTVWPVGTLTSLPYGVRGGILRGPGCVDMKAGLVLAFHALAELSDMVRSTDDLSDIGRAVGDTIDLGGVTLLITCDEEIGSPTSRDLIEKEAAGCAAALVLEAAAAGGALKTGRKGVSRYRVLVHGRAAHAGLEPELGINATVELAHQILALAALAGPARGTTVTPTLLGAGTSQNTVPALGEVAVDVRVRDATEQRRVDAAVHALRPVLPGARLEIQGGPNRPPMGPDATAALFERATGVAARLGLPAPTAAAVGGGSDGNFTAGIGVPTLDGLGAVGGGAHADDEHVIVGELPARAVLIAGLISDLLSR